MTVLTEHSWSCTCLGKERMLNSTCTRDHGRLSKSFAEYSPYSSPLLWNQSSSRRSCSWSWWHKSVSNLCSYSIWQCALLLLCATFFQAIRTFSVSYHSSMLLFRFLALLIAWNTSAWGISCSQKHRSKLWKKDKKGKHSVKWEHQHHSKLEDWLDSPPVRHELRLRHDVTAIAARGGTSCCTVSEGESEKRNSNWLHMPHMPGSSLHACTVSYLKGHGNSMRFDDFWCVLCLSCLVARSESKMIQKKKLKILRTLQLGHFLDWLRRQSCRELTSGQEAALVCRLIMFDHVWSTSFKLTLGKTCTKLKGCHDKLKRLRMCAASCSTVLCLIKDVPSFALPVGRSWLLPLSSRSKRIDVWMCMRFLEHDYISCCMNIWCGLHCLTSSAVALYMIRADVTKDLLERPTPCFRLPRMTRKLGLGGSFGLVLDITGNVYDAWLQDEFGWTIQIQTLTCCEQVRTIRIQLDDCHGRLVGGRDSHDPLWYQTLVHCSKAVGNLPLSQCHNNYGSRR